MKDELDFDKLLNDFLKESNEKKANDTEVDNILNEILGVREKKVSSDEIIMPEKEELPVLSEEIAFDEQFQKQQEKLISDIGRLLEEKHNSSSKEIADEIHRTIEQSNVTVEQKKLMFEKTSGFKKFDIDEFNMIFGSPDENVNTGKKKKKKKIIDAPEKVEEAFNAVEEKTPDQTIIIEPEVKISETFLFNNEGVETDSTQIRMNLLKDAVEDIKEKKGYFRNIMSDEEEDVDETLARDLEYFQSRKEIDEYEGPEDKESVERSLEFQVKEATIKIITAIFMCIPLLVLTLSPVLNITLPGFINPAENMFIYSVAVSILMGILMICCFGTMIHGISSALKFKPDQESLVAMALIFSLAQSLYIAIASPDFDKIPFFYGGIAGIILISNIIGKFLEAKVVLKNFKLVSSNHSKSAVILYDEDNFKGNFPFKYRENEEKACIGVNTRVVSEFLARSYSLENIERKIKPIHYFSFFGPVLICLIKMITGKMEIWRLLTDLALGFSICAPMASTLSYWLPISKLTRHLRKKGATLIGYGSIKKYKYIGAVTLSDKDLFRTKDITISALKFYEPTRIDEYITKIASLLNKTNSEVSNVFMKIVENNKSILSEVTDFSFDKGQGIIGYIDGERIICGSRAYVSSYGVSIPHDSREGNLPISKKVSYVSIGGKLVASFETNYKITRSTFEMFREICHERLDIILYTMDYNLTEELLRQLFVIDGSLVCVIDKTFIPEFEAMTKPCDRVKADIVSITGNKGIAFAVCKIPKINTIMSVGVFMKAITLVISLLIFAAVVFANGVTAATPIHILLFQFIWLLPYLFIYIFSK